MRGRRHRGHGRCADCPWRAELSAMCAAGRPHSAEVSRRGYRVRDLVEYVCRLEHFGHISDLGHVGGHVLGSERGVGSEPPPRHADMEGRYPSTERTENLVRRRALLARQISHYWGNLV